MRRTTKICGATLLGLAMVAALHAAGDGANPVVMTPDQMKWTPGSVPGVMTAVVWGDQAKGAHGAFHKFDAGWAAPLHTHSANTKIVVISGTMAMVGEDGKETKFPAGSFYTQPNTYKHITKCLAGAPCMVYLEADGAWDMKPVGK